MVGPEQVISHPYGELFQYGTCHVIVTQSMSKNKAQSVTVSTTNGNWKYVSIKTKILSMYKYIFSKHTRM